MRVAALDLTPEIFVQFCMASKEGPPRRFKVVQHPLPEDARVLQMQIVNGHNIRLFLTSELFEEVPENEEPPLLPSPVYETVYDPEEW